MFLKLENWSVKQHNEKKNRVEQLKLVKRIHFKHICRSYKQLRYFAVFLKILNFDKNITITMFFK